ncbi:hypothetical protein KFE26_23605 [Shewanella sp. M16]|uniref:hypothetical protein n=1 Tax=Shewanella sp. M16 TaxID=2830837 RepID=UPI001BB09E33|nr:hypothetical protein [Shewanella sp. M16]MBS0045220.1 hypothetical protein [Shewanella sp. M16]
MKSLIVLLLGIILLVLGNISSQLEYSNLSDEEKHGLKVVEQALMDAKIERSKIDAAERKRFVAMPFSEVQKANYDIEVLFPWVMAYLSVSIYITSFLISLIFLFLYLSLRNLLSRRPK